MQCRHRGLTGDRSSKQVGRRVFQTLHLIVQKEEGVTQFRQWRETPHGQSERAERARRKDEPGDAGRGQALMGPVGQVRELGLDLHGHGRS